MPSTDYEQQKKKKSLPFGCSSKVAVCVVICVLCCAVVVVAARWDKFSQKSIVDWFSFSSSTNDSFTVNISGTSVLERNLQNVNNGLVYVSDTSIVNLNYDGEKIFSEQHNFTNPLLKSCSQYSIACNAGGSSFRIISPELGEIYRGTQGSSITDCDINDLGTYCVISDHTGYLSILNAYNKNNEFIFSYAFNDFYAVSVSLNKNGTMAAVGAVNSVEGQMVSKVYILDFTSTEPAYTYYYSDQIIYDVDFVSDDKVAVVTDSLVSVLDSSNGKEIPYSYNNKVLTAYSISYDNGIFLSLSRSDDGRDCSLVSLDYKGDEISSFSTDLKIFSISVKNDKIAILSGNQLYLYNSYGDSFGDWDVGTDAKSVVLPQEKTAYILGVSELRKISLK